MKQYEAVIQALEQMGGQATLADLYLETMKIVAALNCRGNGKSVILPADEH